MQKSNLNYIEALIDTLRIHYENEIDVQFDQTIKHLQSLVKEEQRNKEHIYDEIIKSINKI